jgi:argonaute-like protein implicated in RNA metabolism and viral defense
MSNNKQTAVDWLFKQLWDEPQDKFTWYAILKQAKEMHEQEVMQSLNDGKSMALGTMENTSLEQYYNETFNSDEA